MSAYNMNHAHAANASGEKVTREFRVLTHLVVCNN